MKIKENVTLYYCGFCNKRYVRKHACLEHEEKCSRNPINFRACFNCKHLRKREEEICFDPNDPYEQPLEIKIFYCPQIDSYLYPPKIERNGRCFDLGDESNEPMKKECDLQERVYDFDWADIQKANRIKGKGGEG